MRCTRNRTGSKYCVPYPRLRTIDGPSALTTGRGRRRHKPITARYFGFDGLFCGMPLAFEELVLVVQRLRLKAPIFLEIKRARAALGAAVVEDATASLRTRDASAPSI